MCLLEAYFYCKDFEKMTVLCILELRKSSFQQIDCWTVGIQINKIRYLFLFGVFSEIRKIVTTSDWKWICFSCTFLIRYKILQICSRVFFRGVWFFVFSIHPFILSSLLLLNCSTSVMYDG